MKARKIAVVVACAAATALAFSAGAAAKPGYLVSPEDFLLSAKLPKSNGYAVHLGSIGHRWVEMLVHRGGKSAIYFARGKANRNGVDVDFGRFGHVHARFTGHRLKREPLFPGCRGRQPIAARGRLAGSIRFRGEDGYVTISTERAKASYERYFKLVCRVGTTPGDRELVDVLEATGKAAGHKISFSAMYLASIDVPVISASITEHIDGVIVVKRTVAIEEGDFLEFSPPNGQPQMAAVSPPSPFQGSASYMAQPDGSSEWSGDLRAPFIGLGQVPLTGPSFHADACRVPLSEEILDCKRRPRSAQRSTALARLLYGSGSHSQPLALARLSSLR